MLVSLTIADHNAFDGLHRGSSPAKMTDLSSFGLEVGEKRRKSKKNVETIFVVFVAVVDLLSKLSIKVKRLMYLGLQ